MKKLLTFGISIFFFAVILCSCGAKALAGTYTFGDGANRSMITLNEDGSFVFEFSATSSYLGLGQFSVKDNTLTLETSDGKFHYVFDITNDGLVFDEDASSDMHWYGDFADGSVFE